MVDRTLDQTVRRMLARITLLERRMGKRSAGLPARLSPHGEQVTDWNDAKDVGFYWGNAAAHQPGLLNGNTANYWVGTVHYLDTTVVGSPRILQRLWRPDGAGGPTYTRTFNSGGSGVWSPWAGQETGKTNSAQLLTMDLDTVVVPGVYYQSTVANGTTARHYPVASAAGMLEVFNIGDNDGDQIYQRFTRRGDRPTAEAWMRGKYTTGAWQPWRPIPGDDTGWISTGLWTAQTGWSLTGFQARRVGNRVTLRFLNFTRTGAALNGAMGDIGNTLVASLTDTSWQPGVGTFQLYAANSGRTVTGYVDGNGSIGVSAIAAGLTDSTGVIPTNANLSLAGEWYTD